MNTVLCRRRLAPGLLLLLAACSASGGNDAGPSAGDAGDGGDAGPLDAGAPDAGPPVGVACANDRQCNTQVCGPGGHCCLARCQQPDGGDPACGPVDCDANGACLYPGTTRDCGSQLCAGSQLDRKSCDGAGNCVAFAHELCPGNLACAADSSGCLSACQSRSDCQPGFQCRAGGCIPALTAGYCAGSDACLSGQCVDHACCATVCQSDDAGCGFTACDPQTGACLYPRATSPCGALAARSCAADALTSPLCDGQGRCGPPQTAVCSGSYTCNPTAGDCYDSCLDAGAVACTAADVCNSRSGRCCPALAAGDRVAVDPAIGSDLGCCGAASAPCLTITHAMELIAAARAGGCTIAVANDLPFPHGWSLPETYPVHLGFGVTLSAPGIDFEAPQGLVFDIFPYAGEGDAGPVALVGAAGRVGPATRLLTIGFDPTAPSTTANAIRLSAGSARLDFVAAYGTQTAVEVDPGGALQLGPHQVQIGLSPNSHSDFAAFENNPQVPEQYALRCHGTAAAPASVTFQPDPAVAIFDGGNYALEIGGASQANVELDDRCRLQVPVPFSFGAGFDGTTNADPYRYVMCDQQTAAASLRLTGGASAQLGDPLALVASSAIGCATADGLELFPDDGGGVPSVALSNVVLVDNPCAGAAVAAGTLSAVGSQFSGNHYGVVVVGDAGLDLSDGGDVVVGNDPRCSTPLAANCPPAVGNQSLRANLWAGIINLGSSTLNVSTAQLTLSADAGTQWTCSDATLDSCTCTGTICPGSATQIAPSDSPLVGLSSNPQPFNAAAVTATSAVCPGSYF